MDFKERAMMEETDERRDRSWMRRLLRLSGRWMTALWNGLWAPIRRYFYLTRRDAQGFAVWVGIMGVTMAVKWAYPQWEAARSAADSWPPATVLVAAMPGGGGEGGPAGYRPAGTTGTQVGNERAGVAGGGAVERPSAAGQPGAAEPSGENPETCPSAAPDTASRAKPRAASPYGSPYRKKAFTVDLNLGDTLDFQELRGIGPAYARRIVAYRERLGGFVDKAQLLEVWGVDSALFARIEASVELKSAPFRPLYINRLSVQELKQHPYLDYYQAKEIVRYRERYGAFQTATDLKKVNLMDAETYHRLQPYVSTAPPTIRTPVSE